MQQIILTKILPRLTQISQWFFPFICCLCKTPCSNQRICEECQHALPWLTQCCQQCALPLAQNMAICGDCQKNRRYFDHSVSLFHYQAPVVHVITQFKFHQNLTYGKLLAELMLLKLKKHYQNHTLPQAIIPVPLHKKRLRQRGFNQALELAKPLAKSLCIPLLLKPIKRTRHTAQQSQLNNTQRRKNIRNAFLVSATLPEHIAIVDDIVTTASTINELSQTLKQHGVKRIDVWSIARVN